LLDGVFKDWRGPMRHIAIATSILVLAACGGDEEETNPQPTENTNPAVYDPGKAYEPQVKVFKA